jgi:hypothetical protein
MMTITNFEIKDSRVYIGLMASCYKPCMWEHVQSAKTANFRHEKQTERMTCPWLSLLINKIQSKALLVRFERIDVAIVITIDQSSLIIEFLHEQIMFLKVFDVKLRLVV